MIQAGSSWSGHERNCCFLNTGQTRFADVSASSGLDFADDARGIARIDWDQDGHIDLLITNRNAPRLRLMHNQGAARGSPASIAVRLLGTASKTPRDAIGARLVASYSVEASRGDVTAANRRTLSRSTQTLRAGEGFLSQSSQELAVAIPEGMALERLEIRWPGGAAERFSGPWTRGARYRLVQGSGRAELLEVTRGAAFLEPNEPSGEVEEASPLPVRRTQRVLLTQPLTVPALPAESLEGEGRVLPRQPDRHRLVTLWASWCAPCLREFAVWRSQRETFVSAELDLSALSVDGLDDDRGDRAQAIETARRLRAEFASGGGETKFEFLLAKEETVSILQFLHDTATAMRHPLPVPSSFLLDGRGQLVAIYKGPVEVETLQRDIGLSALSREERYLAAAPLGGSSLAAHPERQSLLDRHEAAHRFQVAGQLASHGKLESSVTEYRSVLELTPEFPEALSNLGLAYLELRRPEAAERHLLRALELRPDLTEAWFNLAVLDDRRGRVPSARKRYERVLELDPRYRGAHDALGVLAAKAGRLGEAAREFQAEIAAWPDSAEAHNHLGFLHLSAGQPTLARPLLVRAVELDANSADARNNLGNAYRRLGQHALARQQLEHAVRLAPAFFEAQYSLGLVLLDLGDPVAAIPHLEAAARIRPTSKGTREQLSSARRAAARPAKD